MKTRRPKYQFAMRFRTLRLLGFGGVLLAFGITGCQTDGGNSPGVGGSVKTRGVYATIAIPDLGLDLPASGYRQRDSFGSEETPAAVIVGYGFGQPELVALQLIES